MGKRRCKLVVHQGCENDCLSFKDDDEAEEESEDGEQDDEMDAQQGPGSPNNNGANNAGGLVALDA